MAVLDKNDPEKKIGLLVDEWEEKGAKSDLFQQNSLRDALVAPLKFNIIREHAERVTMTTAGLQAARLAPDRLAEYVR